MDSIKPPINWSRIEDMDNGNELKYLEVADLDQLPNGERLFLEIDGNPVVIFNIAGNYFAMDDLCTHDDGPIGEGELDGNVVTCPRHGAKFDIRTGKALALPAVEGLKTYPVKCENNKILLGI
jgi:3-phenylpropionate/trans-cinnamate dioxygenase ferredoxin subunit